MQLMPDKFITLALGIRIVLAIKLTHNMMNHP